MTLPQIPTTKPIVAAAGPLGSSPEAWAVSWSSANGPAAPFVVVLTSSLTEGTPPAADATLVTAVWSDGPPGTTLADVGVTSLSPPTGAGSTILSAIDAAVLAATALYDQDDVLDDTDALLRQTIAAAWIVWSINGGDQLPGGAGGTLQTLTQALG